jgi:PAS domain S-box-containing protein
MKQAGSNGKAPKKKSASKSAGHWISKDDFAQLHANLMEAQETLDAIRGGDVDAVVVNGPHGNQIYSLSGADQPYRVYVERMQEGAVTVSHEDVVLYANRRFADMVGKPLEQVIGTDVTTYLDQAACENIHNVFRNQDEVVKYEAILQVLGKPYLPVTLTASHLPLQDQNVVCLVVTDLSAQKQNEQLRTAKEVAEKANKAKDDFLAALSHELRTPLNPVLLLASDGAEDPELPDRTRADFATIRDNIELEARLIDDLLDFNRIVHGKLGLDKSPVDCHEVLDDALAIVEPELRRKHISLTLNLEKSPCQLNADRIRLQQIFWNVLKNAAKFTPDRGAITVTTAVDAPGKNWLITVSDTGMGMTHDEMKKIFDAFAQGEHAKDSGSHQFGGLGLGLSITKMLIKLHEGSIKAYSEGRGKGATFVIQLPLASSPGHSATSSAHVHAR